MKILILCALLGTMAHCKPGGYFRQEYQFKKSSATFKNNELQTKDDDQGFYHKQGDLEGPADVNQHNEQSQYVSPKLGGVGQTVTSYDNRDLTNEAESAFSNHGMGYGGHANSGMNTGMAGAGGGRSYSSYSSYSSYGTTSSGQMSQANMQQLKQNLQQELTECLQEAMTQYRKEAARSSYTASDSSRVHLLENELKSNLTRLLQDALYKNRGSGSVTYTVTATGVYNPQNGINQDLTDIRNQLEQQFLTELRKEVQTISHSQTSRRYGSSGHTYYDSAEIEDLNRRPNRYAASSAHSQSYGSSYSHGDQQSTERITYASALNSGTASRPNYNTHTSARYEPIHVSINPSVRLTDVMQNIQNNAHRQISEALRVYEEKYTTTSSYRLTNSRPSYEASLNDFKEQLRYNLTDQIQRELEKNYGVQTKLQGYSFSLNAGNTANYKLEDFDNLKKTMENNLNTFLENTLRQQESRYQQQVTTMSVQNRDYTHHGPQFTKGLTDSSLRYQPTASSQSQTSYGSNYQHNNAELEEITRRLQSELSRQLQTAIEQQRRTHTSNYQAQNSQVLYQELEEELKRNITRQLQESLNKNYGNQGNRGGYSYTVTSGVYNPNANYQTQDLNVMMKQMQVDLEKQLREQMSSSGYKQGNYVVVSGGPYVVPNRADTGLYASSSYPMKVQSPTKSLNKYQQFSSYSHSASDMHGEDCTQNGGHDHGYHQRIRRDAGGYYHGFEQHQHQLQQQYMHNPQPYFSPPGGHHFTHNFNGYHPVGRPAYFPEDSNTYSQHHHHGNEEVGQQFRDLDNLGQQPESSDNFHFGQPAYYSSIYPQQHHGYNGQETEELGQQLEDLDNLGQQPEDLDNFGQQPEDLGQQLEEFGLSYDPECEDVYSDLALETSQKPNKQLTPILPKREQVKPAVVLKPLASKPQNLPSLKNPDDDFEEVIRPVVIKPQYTPKPQHSQNLPSLGNPDDDFEEVIKPQHSQYSPNPQHSQNPSSPTKPDDDFEEVGQQLEELGQQTEDFGGPPQQAQYDDYFELVPPKPKPSEQLSRTLPKREPAVVTKPQYPQKPYDEFEEIGQQLEDLDDPTQQTDAFGGQQLEDLGQQLEDVDDGFEKLQTGKPQSGNFNSGNPATAWQQRDPPQKHDEDLGQQIEELGQQLEDLDSLGQQPDHFGNLGQQLEDFDGLTQQTEDHYGNLETGRDWGQQSEDDFGKLESLNHHVNPVYVRPPTPKPVSADRDAVGQNFEDFQHTEDILANVNKPAYVPYRGLNLPRPTTSKPITSSKRYDEDIYAHNQPNNRLFVNANVPKIERDIYVPYRGLNLPRPTTPKPNNLNQYNPSYVRYSPSATPKPITSASLYHPDDDTQQLTQDIFGHTKPLSTSDDFVDHGDYLQYVGDRKDITHMESMDRINQQVQISQQHEPPRRAISLSEANGMYIGRNRDANTPRDFHYARNEPTPQDDLTQQSEDLGQQLEDLDLTQQSEHFGDLTQQSEDFGDLTQQSEDFGDLTQQSQDLGQQLEDLTQQTEDFNVEQQHAKMSYEPPRPFHTASVNQPPRTEVHPGYGRGLDTQPRSSYASSYGRSLSQQHSDGRSLDEQHSMPNSEASSHGRSLDDQRISTPSGEGMHDSESLDTEKSTLEGEKVETAPTEPTGFWKSFGGKVSSSFSSVKQKAKNLMG